MKREKIFSFLAFVTLILLIFLLFRFKPSIVGPKEIEKLKIDGSKKVVSAKNFQYEVRQKDKVKYKILAEEIIDGEEGDKELKNVNVIIPRGEKGEEKVVSKKGRFNEIKNELRVYEDARIILMDGITIKSDAYRITPQNEVVSEGRSYFNKDKINGSSDILRYDREERIIYLEGNVFIKGENLSFSSSRLYLNLNTHLGEIDGPINFEKDDLKVNSPLGRVFLTDDNKLKEITLFKPIKGETNSLNFSSKTAILYFGKNGNLEKSELVEDVVLVSKSDESGKLLTKKLILTNTNDHKTLWESPFSVTLLKKNFTLLAKSGKGDFKDKYMNGILDGPTRGFGEETEASSNYAEIKQNDIIFIGDVQAVSKKNTIESEKLIRENSGNYRGIGNVRGKTTNERNETTFYECDEADFPPSKYPILLNGRAKIYSNNFILRGEKFTLLDENTFKGCDGVTGEFYFEKEKVLVNSLEMEYFKNKRKAAFYKNPSAVSLDSKLLSKESITLFLDDSGKLDKVLALDEGYFENNDIIAKGEKITYFPKTKEGEAFSEKGISYGIEKGVSRRVKGKVIYFKNKDIFVKGLDNRLSRGKIEGVEEKRKK